MTDMLIRHRFKDDDGEYVWLMTPSGSGHCRACFLEGDEDGYIDFLSVTEENRGKGIATMLLKECERIVSEDFGQSKVWLWVEDPSWMKEWYERCGYGFVCENMCTPGTSWMSKELSVKGK
jgi:GNAT superfamily N-acetyltransferase